MEMFAQRAIAGLRQAMGAGLLALVGLTLTQVTLRYLFHHSPTGSRRSRWWS